MRFEYKVVEKKAKGVLGGRIKAEGLAKVLNQYAADGWELDRLLDNASYPSLSIDQDVFYIIFRRPDPAA